MGQKHIYPPYAYNDPNLRNLMKNKSNQYLVWNLPNQNF